jgi:predicted ribosomally synthesized peptide with nif11-like leader
MSTESVRQFLLAISTDSALQEKLTAVTDSVNFVQMVQESGYSFTLEDLQAHLAQHNGDELSEDELEAVTGGAGFPGGIGSHIPILPRPGVGPGGYGSTPRYTQTQDLSIL